MFLKLQLSKSVKILFRNRDTGEPIIKDLDIDSLAKNILLDNFKNPSTLAYRETSAVIQRARGKWNWVAIPWTNVLSILKQRYTSWARDRLIIASILVSVHEFDSTWSKPKMNKAILLHGKILDTTSAIPQGALLHGQVTMCDNGPWSWCPMSRIDIGTAINGKPFKVEKSGGVSYNATTLQIKETGAVTGLWSCRPLYQKDVHPPLGSHRSVTLRIESALRNKEKCLLLNPPLDRKQGRCLLVMNFGAQSTVEIKMRHCQYIGAVDVSNHGADFYEEICLGSPNEADWLKGGVSRG
jgi:hypothetical protein